MKVYLASSNRGKLRELQALANDETIVAQALPDLAKLPAAIEKDSSFALNALEKALHYSRFTEEMVVADDSGLAVDSLGGRPGVQSARYAGPQATDEQNNKKLIRELEGIPAERRTARYVCVLALAQQGRTLALFSDSCKGRILDEPCGRGGFGYDPYFFFPPLGKTLAETAEAEKNQHSHRGKAFRKLLHYLKDPPWLKPAG